jgi:hypothetical protein
MEEADDSDLEVLDTGTWDETKAEKFRQRVEEIARLKAIVKAEEAKSEAGGLAALMRSLEMTQSCRSTPPPSSTPPSSPPRLLGPIFGAAPEKKGKKRSRPSQQALDSKKLRQ